MLTVSGKAVGRRKPLFADFSVPPPTAIGDGGRCTLRRLIECIVCHEVEAFRQRQSDRQLIRVLTTTQIEAGVEAGKVDSGQSEVAPQEVDEKQSVDAAIQAFEDGLFLVVIDETEQKELDAQLYLQDSSRVTFVRLTALAGG